VDEAVAEGHLEVDSADSEEVNEGSEAGSAANEALCLAADVKRASKPKQPHEPPWQKKRMRNKKLLS
jgi:hypothetical protein